METEIPKISPVVRNWMPDTTEEELIEATDNFRRHLKVVYRIFTILEDQGYYEATKEELMHWNERSGQ